MEPPDGDRQLRRAELVGALAAVRGQLADACAAAGRDVRSVTLIAVTKTYPATDVQTLLELGALDIGESRDQEAVAKIAELDALLAPDIARPRWHFVGRLQSRKSRSVATYATAVHSVDRPELVRGLAEGVRRAGRPPLEVFVQVSLDGDPARGGVRADALPGLADVVAAEPELRLRGVMAVAPLGTDPDQAFGGLAQIAAGLRERHPGADAISAGMSADLAAAVRHGSTHVRVGTALLGRRSPDVG
ncbi:MAG: dependent protein [Pseudonocardiales bacterium]|nr:dependent protein [Pseudonocardiales bacterium]